MSLSLKEEGSERLSSLTISNEKEVRFGKNLGSASSKEGGETIEKEYTTTFSMSKEVRKCENIEKEKKNEEERKRKNNGIANLRIWNLN